MFRPNRVGTPYIFAKPAVINTNAVSMYVADPTGNASYRFNAINAANVLDFAYSNIYTTGAGAIAANQRGGFAQCITIPPPLAGDVVGLELNGFFTGPAPGDMSITPVFGPTGSSPTILGPVEAANGDIVVIGESLVAIPAATTVSTRSLRYTAQVIVRDTTRLFGNYLHGFALTAGPTAWAKTWAHIGCSVRQLNDQQLVGYRDTLR